MAKYLKEEEKWAIFNTMRLLKSISTREGIDDEQVEVAIDCLSAAFELNTNDNLQIKQYSCFPKSISDFCEMPKESTNKTEIDDELKSNPKFLRFLEGVKERGMFRGIEEGTKEYQNRMDMVLEKFKQRYAGEAKIASSKFAEAEEFKEKGNKAFHANDLKSALDFYTKAIDASRAGPNSHLYYNNRSAVYCKLNKLERACADAESCISLKPTFAKGHSRLGYSHFHLGRYAQAVTSYRAALNIEPSNTSWQECLSNAIEKQNAARATSSPAPNSNATTSTATTALPGATPQSQQPNTSSQPAPGMPNLSEMMNNPEMMNAAASMLGGGGGGGLAGIMNNPQFMSMAQNVMSNPAMMESMMGMMSGNNGAGGMDLGALASMMGGGAPNATPATNNTPAIPVSDVSDTSSAPSLSTNTAASSSNSPDDMMNMMANMRNNPAMMALRDDPELQEFFQDLERSGPMGAMRHLSNPQVMAKVTAAMSASSS